MWSRLYRNHAMIPCPTFDTASASWVPQVAISWWEDVSRRFEFVEFPDRVTSEEEAVRCALARAETWVDHRLGGISERS
ncbi:MAG TPA: hypothetical protein VNN77_15535 [candidate division Zixibacteria bacterium]|nr:hypothetical protein [candidate division Zixibacteria bacterium]